MKKKKQSEFSKILCINPWLATIISEKENIWKDTITKIKNTSKWHANIKHNIYCYLVEHNYIRIWEYTLTELFNKIE